MQEKIDQAKQLQQSLNQSWKNLRRNDTNLLYASGMGILSAFIKRPFFALLGGFAGGFMYNRRAQLVSKVRSEQTLFISSYQKMMRYGGVAAFNDPDVVNLTETVADNTSLQSVQTWEYKDLQRQNPWWCWWRRPSVSEDTRSHLKELSERTPQSTDLTIQDVNLNQLENDLLKRGEEIMEDTQAFIQRFRPGK